MYTKIQNANELIAFMLLVKEDPYLAGKYFTRVVNPKSHSEQWWSPEIPLARHFLKFNVTELNRYNDLGMPFHANQVNTIH